MRFGFRQLAEYTGINTFFARAGVKSAAHEVVAILLFWVVFLFFVVSAINVLQMPVLATALQKLVSFLPKLIVVVLLLTLGSFLSRLAGAVVRSAAVGYGKELADLLGKVTTNLILLAVIFMSISHLELRSQIFNQLFVVLVGTAGLAVALSLGFGTRSVTENILAGMYARRQFQSGQELILSGHTKGTLDVIGTTKASIRTEDGVLTVPNRALLDSQVLIRS